MFLRYVALAAALFVTLSGCASIVEGTHQDIYVNATPENMDCVASRQGHPIGHYDQVTRILTVSKSREDMVLNCKAPGYKPKSMTFVSSASAWGVAGALTLDLGIVDYTTGALNKYDATITVVLEQEARPATAVLSSTDIPIASITASATSTGAQTPGACTHEQQVQARIAHMNGYTGGPKCD